MAVTWEGIPAENQRRGSVYNLLPEDITVEPKLNGRFELPKLDNMIKSMLKFGQLQPVVIRKDGGKPVLVSGRTRWRAALEINSKKLYTTGIPFKLACVYKEGNREGGFLQSIIENHHRNPTTVLDDAHNILILKGQGMTEEEIADVYLEPVRWVRDRVELANLSKSAKQAFIAGSLKAPAAKALAKLSSDVQDAKIESLKEGKPLKAADLKASVNGKSTVDRPKTFKPVLSRDEMDAVVIGLKAGKFDKDYASLVESLIERLEDML